MKKLFAGCLITIFAIPIAAICVLALIDPDLLEQLFWGALYGLGGAVVLCALIAIWWMHNRQQRRERTYIDGALPLMKRRRHIWRTDIPRPLAVWSLVVGEEFYIDPNRMMSPAWSFDAFGRVSQAEPAGGWQLQHQYNLAVEHTNAVRAIAQGDDSRNTLFGRDSMPARLPARVLTPRPQAPELPMIEEQPQQPAEAPITPSVALERSQNGAVLIGQQKDGARQLATWDSNAASTLGIFGANGTGKTACIATMVTLAMVRWGWRLWILDGKDAGDWDEFAPCAAVAPVSQHNIEDVMQGVWEEYQRREKVMSEYRARHYRQLPADVQAEFPPWGVVFEEFGATRLGLRAKTRAQLDQCVGILCQKARYTGWHGVFIDQRPSNYTDEMKGNLKAIACFQLKMNQGHAVNAYHADKLAPRGEFEMDGGRYWAFHAEPLARPMLARLPVRGGRSLPFVDAPDYERLRTVTNDSRTAIPEANGANVRERAGDDSAETLVSVYERTRSWDAVAKSFFERDSSQTQSDLRRLMVLISADGRDQNAFKGEAYRLYHLYNPYGNNFHA